MGIEEWDLQSLRISGEEVRNQPLSWGQGTMWENITVTGPESRRLNILGGFPIRSRVSVSEALRRLRECLERFDVFRLAFDLPTVSATFRAEAHVDVFLKEDPGYLCVGIDNKPELYHVPFALTDTPIRIELLHHGGSVTQVGTALSHLPFDGAAYRLLIRHLQDAVEGRDLTRTGMQTQQMLEYEQSPAGRRQSEVAIAGWTTAATTLPAGRGLMPTMAGAYTVTEIRSPALAIAAQYLAVTHGASTASVLAAALATMIQRHFDQPPAALQSVCNNRMRPELADFVGQTIGNGLLVLPERCSDRDFAAYLKMVNARAIASYARARYDSAKWRAELFELSVRGHATDLSFYFNDVRFDRDLWAGLERRIDDLRRGLAQDTSIKAIDHRKQSDATLFAHVHKSGQECWITLVCDDSVINPADVAVLLEHLDTFVVEQALAA